LEKNRLQIIESTIKKIPCIENLNNIIEDEVKFNIKGNVSINFEELDTPLTFDFRIGQEYPLKSYGSESITFLNKSLIPYSHVMEAGNICIHTSHSADIQEKLKIDFDSLKKWIIKYYINGEKDSKFEHIIVNPSTVNDFYYSYAFNELDSPIPSGDYGYVNLSLLNPGTYKNKIIANHFVQDFESINGQKRLCNWNNFYKDQKLISKGIYYFLDELPASHNKFIYEHWDEIELPTKFLNFLYNFENNNYKKHKGTVIPLFIGYRISDKESHWQAALLEVGKFPLKGVLMRKNGKKTGNWESSLLPEKIKWSLTRNVSYEYFFGRGTFSKELREKKILIIGIGAVGSIVAQTLTRCGCKFIDFIDYDTKEPENVCRSEYKYSNGISLKSEELIKILSEISPYVNINRMKNHYFEQVIKAFYESEQFQNNFEEATKKYDLIIDCSADNDLMYVLNSLKLKIDLINISITNHAKELICAFHPNIYRFVNNQFSNVLENDTKDLYEPTGCWDPTFKASYNDINVLVQFALKHINQIFEGVKAKNNFVIGEDDGNLKIIEY
jgi:hypothetical protein